MIEKKTEGRWKSKQTMRQCFNPRLLKSSVIVVILLLFGFLCATFLNLIPNDPSIEAEPKIKEHVNELTNIDNFKKAFLKANCQPHLLQEAQTMRVKGRIEQAGEVFEFCFFKKRPNQFIFIVYSQEAETRYIVNGDKVWRSMEISGQAKPEVSLLPSQEAEPWRMQSRFFDGILGSFVGESTLQKIELKEFESRYVLEVRITDLKYTASSVILVDVETMLPFLERKSSHSSQIQEIFFSDHRSIDGMMIPFKIEKQFNGEVKSKVSLSSVAFNIGIPSELFSM